MAVVLYPDECKHKYAFTTSNQTAIVTVTQENRHRTSSSPFVGSLSKVVHVGKGADSPDEAGDSPGWPAFGGQKKLRFPVSGCEGQAGEGMPRAGRRRDGRGVGVLSSGGAMALSSPSAPNSQQT